ncbi:MAG: hypothetical protein A3I72_16760 [Candidatus Tectomicrobia bacterium RIFCSPLOWO2_02_FULL_70_19]|nr:MAG: hypothetical protein A3I72_16760 [Candidatus Tectomicrobia bacterium RIFCSPLOWO2_02_FULL_70_19]
MRGEGTVDPQVVSVSRRTDVPAFHVPWLLKRLEEGFAEYRNPFSGQRHRVSLLPEDVRAFVFWTRNPAPLLPHLDRIGAPFYFLYTVNGYPEALERAVPPLGQAVRTFRKLAERVGPGRVRWRYDPIYLSKETDPAFHRRNFARIASALEGLTRECIASFADMYGKVKRNAAKLPGDLRPEEGTLEARKALMDELAGMAGERGMRLLACCEDALVGGPAGKARCVDPELLDRIAPLSGGKLPLRPTREECGCAASRDIGAYDTCPHGCVYCYANASPGAALSRYRKRDASLPWLG